MSATLIRKIQSHLTPDLLSPKWREIAATTNNPLCGHCYVAAEVAFHVLGGIKQWQSFVLTHQLWPEGLDAGETHWFIKNRTTGKIVDPTARQFSLPVEYKLGRASGFLTRQPSKRAQRIIDQLNS